MRLFVFSAVTRQAEDLEDTSTSGSSYKDAAVQTGNASNATTPTYTAAVGDRMSASLKSICTEPLKKKSVSMFVRLKCFSAASRWSKKSFESSIRAENAL